MTKVAETTEVALDPVAQAAAEETEAPVENIVLPFQVSPAIVEQIISYKAAMESLEKQQEETHDALWAGIHAAYPHLDENACYSLDKKYLAQGVVMLKGCESCGDKGGIPGPIKVLLKKIPSDIGNIPKSMTDE